MNRMRVIVSAVCLLFLAFAWNAFGADEFASMSVSPGEIVWHPLAANGGVTLSVSGPDNFYVRKEVGAGGSPALGITEDSGKILPEGQYSYELVFAPSSGTAVRGDDQQAVAADPVIQSGSFRVLGGQFVVPTAVEGQSAITAQAIPDGGIVPLDQVIADDLIVQQSLCVGFDCVNGESFGFDTIRLKENNTRIKFEDTSTGSFPSNDWQLTANDSSSGGQNKFSIEDITGAKVPFTIEAGATSNSLYVDSTGRIGLRTSTPVLDLHINTSNTPGVRLEQNNSGGFTAQTWDIAGNEANFFIRDVTGGSRLPFRIRPGAPTSSIDISANGNIGAGTASPQARLHVEGNTPPQFIVSNIAGNARMDFVRKDATSVSQLLFGNGTPPSHTLEYQMGTFNDSTFQMRVVNQPGQGIAITSTGKVGIGTTGPTHALQVCGTSGCSYNEGGTTWVNASSREYKDNVEALSAARALDTLQGLSPVTYSYKGEPERGRVGFIAEDVPDLVAMKDRKGLSPLDIVAVLTKVVQEQNRTIEELKAELTSLRETVSRITTK